MIINHPDKILLIMVLIAGAPFKILHYFKSRKLLFYIKLACSLTQDMCCDCKDLPPPFALSASEVLRSILSCFSAALPASVNSIAASPSTTPDLAMKGSTLAATLVTPLAILMGRVSGIPTTSSSDLSVLFSD